MFQQWATLLGGLGLESSGFLLQISGVSREATVAFRIYKGNSWPAGLLYCMDYVFRFDSISKPVSAAGTNSPVDHLT